MPDRIPVLPNIAPQKNDFLVLLGDITGPGKAGHEAGCACCLPRSQAAAFFGKIFTDRARGNLPWFDRVVVHGDAALLRDLQIALCEDRVTAARFCWRE
jgi:hypothetical protein